MFAKLRRVTWKASLLAALKALVSFSIVLAASGGLDLTFSGDGKQTTNVAPAHPTWDDRAFGLAIQSFTKIVAVGQSTDGTDSDIAVARYNANGSLDTTFSGDGRLTTNLGAYEKAHGVAVQPNGYIVVVGTRCTDSSYTVCKVVVLRYKQDGALDATFNGTGRKMFNYGGLSTDGSGGIAIQGDGKIIVSATILGAESDFAVFRLTSTGAFDTTFHGTGRQRINFGPGTGDGGGWGQNLALQKDGKIVVSGGTGNNFAVMRLNSNGSLDATFSGDGKQVTNFGGSDYSFAVAEQSNGKIVAAGVATVGANSYFAVARYNANGAPDTTFNGSGKKLVDFAGSVVEAAPGLAITPQGKIVLGGDADFNQNDFAIARLNTDGSLDSTFSADGKATFDFKGGFDRARALVIDTSGKYVMAGLTTVNGHLDFGVLRVLP